MLLKQLALQRRTSKLVAEPALFRTQARNVLLCKREFTYDVLIGAIRAATPSSRGGRGRARRSCRPAATATISTTTPARAAAVAATNQIVVHRRLRTVRAARSAGRATRRPVVCQHLAGYFRSSL